MVKLEQREDVQEFIRQKIGNLLSGFTEGRVVLFLRLYGKVDKIPPEKLAAALDVCERTQKKIEEVCSYHSEKKKK